MVYRERIAVKRWPMWDEINSIRAASQNNDWLIIGDFNEIRHPSEREGHESFDRAGATEFEAAIVGFTELSQWGENSPSRTAPGRITLGRDWTEHLAMPIGYRDGPIFA